MWEIGNRLRESRELAKLKQGQVAEYEDISKSYVSQLESGDNQPNWELLARLARRYKVSADYILGLIDKPMPIERKQVPAATLSIREQGEFYAPRAVDEMVRLMWDLSEERQRAILNVAKIIADIKN